MAAPAQKWAVLIGINDYGEGGLYEKQWHNFDKKEITFSNLRGCVNDIIKVKKYLVEVHEVPEQNIKILAKPCPEHPNDNGGSKCSECSIERPTYDNIMKALCNITEDARKDGSNYKRNDLVYIHYSGHGARTTTIYPGLKNLSDSRNSTCQRINPDPEDDAIVPCDIMTRRRFLRDVEFADILDSIAEEGLFPTIVLDCCHAGGANRSTNDWKDNKDVMVRGIEDVIQSELVDPLDSEYPQKIKERQDYSPNWLYSKKRKYVIFAACQKFEKASEKNGKGAFTSWLLDGLRILSEQGHIISAESTFDLINSIHGSAGIQKYNMQNQKPLFLGNKEKSFFSEAQINTQIIEVLSVQKEKRTVQLNRGRTLYVQIGSVYNIVPLGSGLDCKSPIAQVRVTEIDCGWSRAIFEPSGLSECDADHILDSMKGCQAVLHSLPQEKKYTVRLKTDNEALRGQFNDIWNKNHKNNAVLTLKEDKDSVVKFEIVTEGSKFVVHSKDVEIAAMMRNISSLSISTEEDISPAVEKLVLILEHLTEYQRSMVETGETSDLIEVVPQKDLSGQGIQPDGTGRFQAENKQCIHLRISNKSNQEVYFAFLAYTAEFGIKIYNEDSSYDTLAGNLDNGVEARFHDVEVTVEVQEHLQEAFKQGWKPVETYKIIASVDTADVAGLNKSGLKPLLDIVSEPAPEPGSSRNSTFQRKVLQRRWQTKEIKVEIHPSREKDLTENN
ncbi:hypothetical protein TWF730_009400 [Orbilia blumenaviensis]|uniref:Peptidase C14 caspase domain-containing protein n=1 Tax=Orbilia blumenaviensis TaxID=1796055 RepID=A0AAV9V4R0_9PEZI